MMNQAQIERIREMEAAFHEAAACVDELQKALDRFEAVLPKMKALTGYYESSLWLKDYEDDETGKIPSDLPRGVLSQDGVYHLLTDIQNVQAAMAALMGASDRCDVGSGGAMEEIAQCPLAENDREQLRFDDQEALE